MAKTKIQFVCQSCGYISSKWLGHCPGCDEWNSIVEEQIIPSNLGIKAVAGSKPQPLHEVDSSNVPRRNTGIAEFDRVLGGGIVPGSLLLIGGDPGIGKSTLLLQTAASISRQQGSSVLYVSGEESAAQTKMRAERIGELQKNLLVMTETNLEEILSQANALKPVLLVIDSIQTMFSQDIPSAPGSVGQVRESTGKLLRFAKGTNIPVAIIGHVTKEGNIAGPRLLEHMVDVVLYFEGERNYAFRILRAIKNRFGSTSESGIFAMEETGLVQVSNPSALLLSERPCGVPGSVVFAGMEGMRPLLLEIQALVSKTCFGMPRRMAVGFDYNRLLLLMAVLEKRVGLALSEQDAYVNAVGGIKTVEPAADLAVALAIISSFRNVVVHAQTVVMGEIGLTGEIRMVSRVEQRITEAATLGFKRFVVPLGNFKNLKIHRSDLQIVGVSQLTEAMEAVFI